jgi:hypothetical protein
VYGATCAASTGRADMYNLTAANDHTYAVGAGQWVVHNDDGVDPFKLLRSLANSPEISSLFGNGLQHAATQHSHLRYLAYVFQAGYDKTQAGRNLVTTPITGFAPPHKVVNTVFRSGPWDGRDAVE